MPAKIERLLDGQVGKVLAAEGNDLAPGHEARQLVVPVGRTKAAEATEATELDAADRGADGRPLGRPLGRWPSRLPWATSCETSVGVEAVFDVLERLERWVLLRAAPGVECRGLSTTVDKPGMMGSVR